MKVALCKARTFPPERKQDGFTVLRPEITYDLIAEIEVSDPATSVVEWNKRYFVRSRTGEQYTGNPLFSEAKKETSIGCEVFNPRTLKEGDVCIVKVDADFNGKKVWIQAKVSDINESMGTMNELLWVDYIEPLDGKMLINIPAKYEEVRQFPV